MPDELSPSGPADTQEVAQDDIDMFAALETQADGPEGVQPEGGSPPPQTPPVAPPVPPAAPIVPAAPVPTPVPVPVASVPVVEVGTPPPVAAPPAPDAETPEVVRTRLTEVRNRAIAEAEAAFVLPEEMANQFLPEQAEALKKLAALQQIDMFDRLFFSITAALPTLMGSVEQTRTAAQSNEQEFFGAYPVLAPHKQDVTAAMAQYRAVYPQASKEEVMRAVGTMVMAQKGLLGSIGAVPNPPAPPTGAPQPYRPAAPHAAGSGGAPATDEWATMLNVYNSDDY